MGWSCSVNLYLPQANVAAGLHAVAESAEPGSTEPCEVRLPDGMVLRLPFGSREGASTRLTLGADPIGLELVLKVPVDEVIEEWWDEEPYTEGGTQFVGIGVIRLWVSLGAKYAEMRFYGPSGDVSTILSNSPAVHELLLSILGEAGGIAGAIIDEDGNAKLLSDLATELQIDWKRADRGDGDPDPDKLADEVIRQSQERFT